MGSAAACHLARRGLRVLGLERYTAPHDRGASHGRTRVIRQSYYEDPAYVPLLLRAYELWHELSRETGVDLLHEVGGLMMGDPSSAVVTGSLRSARLYGLPHEELTAADIRRRFPAFQPPPGTVALYERAAGFVRTEAAVQAHLDRAAALGADLHFEEPALAWEETAGGVRVRTARGTYEAERLVICPGPWAPTVLAGLGVGGIEPFRYGHFPIFIWETADGASPYGFPAIDGPNGGVKVAFYRAPEVERCDPDSVDRVLRPREIALMRQAVEPLLPALRGPLLQGVTCLYTNTPDKHFVIAPHPASPRVTVACGFSGHGFKFCSVVGEILAQLVVDGRSRLDIGLFSPSRFAT
jgi:sarcosine oxidase